MHLYYAFGVVREWLNWILFREQRDLETMEFCCCAAVVGYLKKTRKLAACVCGFTCSGLVLSPRFCGPVRLPRVPIPLLHTVLLLPRCFARCCFFILLSSFNNIIRQQGFHLVYGIRRLALRLELKAKIYTEFDWLHMDVADAVPVVHINFLWIGGWST